MSGAVGNCPGAPYLIVGMKTDLRNSDGTESDAPKKYRRRSTRSQKSIATAGSVNKSYSLDTKTKVPDNSEMASMPRELVDNDPFTDRQKSYGQRELSYIDELLPYQKDSASIPTTCMMSPDTIRVAKAEHDSFPPPHTQINQDGVVRDGFVKPICAFQLEPSLAGPAEEMRSYGISKIDRSPNSIDLSNSVINTQPLLDNKTESGAFTLEDDVVVIPPEFLFAEVDDYRMVPPDISEENLCLISCPDQTDSKELEYSEIETKVDCCDNRVDAELKKWRGHTGGTGRCGLSSGNSRKGRSAQNVAEAGSRGVLTRGMSILEGNVTTQDGKMFAMDCNAVRYMECSSLQRRGIQDIITESIYVAEDFMKKSVTCVIN